MMAPATEDLLEAKTRWMSFATHVAYSMLAGDLAVAYYIAGDRRRAQAETRTAIGEAAAVISRALDIRYADASWASICDAMISAADLYVAGLEGQLSEIRRNARIPGMSRSDQKKLAEIGMHWAAAILEARALYASLGGDPNELTAFTDFYAVLKAGGLTVAQPLTIPPWPAMEN